MMYKWSFVGVKPGKVIFRPPIWVCTDSAILPSWTCIMLLMPTLTLKRGVILVPYSPRKPLLSVSRAYIVLFFILFKAKQKTKTNKTKN